MRDFIGEYINQEEEWENDHRQRRSRPIHKRRRATDSGTTRNTSHIAPIRDFLHQKPDATLEETVEYLKKNGVVAKEADIAFTHWLETRREPSWNANDSEVATEHMMKSMTVIAVVGVVMFVILPALFDSMFAR